MTTNIEIPSHVSLPAWAQAIVDTESKRLTARHYVLLPEHDSRKCRECRPYDHYGQGDERLPWCRDANPVCPDCNGSVPGECFCRVWEPVRRIDDPTMTVMGRITGYVSGPGRYGQMSVHGAQIHGVRAALPAMAQVAEWLEDLEDRKLHEYLQRRMRDEMDFERFGPAETRCKGCGYQVVEQSRHALPGYHMRCSP